MADGHDVTGDGAGPSGVSDMTDRPKRPDTQPDTPAWLAPDKVPRGSSPHRGTGRPPAVRAPKGAASSEGGAQPPAPAGTVEGARPPAKPALPPAGMEGRSASTGWHRAGPPSPRAPVAAADEPGDRPDETEARRTTAETPPVAKPRPVAKPPQEVRARVAQPQAPDRARPQEAPEETEERSASDDRLRAWAISPEAQEVPDEAADDFAIIERIVPQTKPRGLLGISFGSIKIDEEGGVPFTAEPPRERARATTRRSLLSLFRRERNGPDEVTEGEEADDAFAVDDEAQDEAREAAPEPVARAAPRRRGQVTPTGTEADLPGPPPKALRQPYPELRQPIGLKPRRPDPFPELHKPPDQRRPRPEPFPELRKPNLGAQDEDSSSRLTQEEEKRPAAGWLSGVLKSAERSVGQSAAAAGWFEEGDEEDAAGGEATEAEPPEAPARAERTPAEISVLSAQDGTETDWSLDADYRQRTAEALAQAAWLDERDTAQGATASPLPAFAADPALEAEETPSAERRRARSRKAGQSSQLELGLPSEDQSVADPLAAAPEDMTASGEPAPGETVEFTEPEDAEPAEQADAGMPAWDDEEEDTLLEEAEPAAEWQSHPYTDQPHVTPIHAREAADSDYGAEPLTAEPALYLPPEEEEAAAETEVYAIGEPAEETDFYAEPAADPAPSGAFLAEGAPEAYDEEWVEDEPRSHGEALAPETGSEPGDGDERLPLRYADLLDPTYRPKRGFMDLGRRSILFPSDADDEEGATATDDPRRPDGADAAADPAYAEPHAFAPEDMNAAPEPGEWQAERFDSGPDGMGRLTFRSATELAEGRTAVNGHTDTDDEDDENEDGPAFFAPEPTGRPERAAAVMRSIADSNTDYYLPPSKTPGMIIVGVAGAACGALLANTVYGMLGDIVVPHFMVILIGIQILGGIGVFLGSLMPGVPARSGGRRSKAIRHATPDNRAGEGWEDEEEGFDPDRAPVRPSGRGREPVFARHEACATMRPSARG